MQLADKLQFTNFSCMFRIKRTQVAGELQKEVQLNAASDRINFASSLRFNIQCDAPTGH